MEIKQEVLRLRIEAARDAQKRSRLAFLTSTVASLAIVIAIWNAGIAWDRRFALADKWANNPVTEEAQRLILSEWVKNMVIAFAPLGIRVATSDMAILGSLGLLVVSVWVYHAFRTENYVIGSLLTDTQEGDRDIMFWVFHGVASYLMFTPLQGNAAPIDHLHISPRSGGSQALFRYSFRFLVFLPVIAAAFSILMDVLSLVVLKPAFRYPHTTLVSHLEAADWAVVAIYDGVDTHGLTPVALTAKTQC